MPYERENQHRYQQMRDRFEQYPYKPSAALAKSGCKLAQEQRVDDVALDLHMRAFGGPDHGGKGLYYSPGCIHNGVVSMTGGLYQS
jgi:hypothetical protein